MAQFSKENDTTSLHVTDLNNEFEEQEKHSKYFKYFSEIRSFGTTIRWGSYKEVILGVFRKYNTRIIVMAIFLIVLFSVLIHLLIENFLPLLQIERCVHHFPKVAQ